MSIQTRAMTVQDFPTLQAAIDADKFHPGEWKIDHFLHDPASDNPQIRVKPRLG
jgi:hypothetical protein